MRHNSTKFLTLGIILSTERQSSVNIVETAFQLLRSSSCFSSFSFLVTHLPSTDICDCQHDRPSFRYRLCTGHMTMSTAIVNPWFSEWLLSSASCNRSHLWNYKLLFPPFFFLCVFFFFFCCCGAATQRGSWPPHSRGF
jgi:hypothetical protein